LLILLAAFACAGKSPTSPAPTVKSIFPPSPKQAALYQGYQETCTLLQDRNFSGALAKLGALQQSDPKNALPYYLSAYARQQQGDKQQALADIRKGNAKTYFITYLGPQGWTGTTHPEATLFRQMDRDLVAELASDPAGARAAGLEAISAMGEKVITGRPFNTIMTLVGMALLKISDNPLLSTYQELGDNRKADGVRDRSARLARLKTSLMQSLEILNQNPDPALAASLEQGKPLPQKALGRHMMKEEQAVGVALKKNGFLKN
jgi:hypothetical protein